MLPTTNRFTPFPFHTNPQFVQYFIPPFYMPHFQLNFQIPTHNLFPSFTNQIQDTFRKCSPINQGDQKSKDSTFFSSLNKSQGSSEPKLTVSTNIKQKYLKTKKQSLKDQSDSEQYIIQDKSPKIVKLKQFKITQNQNRNIVPCMVQQVMAFICKQSKSGLICARVLKHFNMPNFGGVKNYYGFMKTIKSRQSHYVNVKSLNVLSSNHRDEVQAFQKQEKEFYLKVARTLARYFLQTKCLSCICSSTKVNTKKKEHQFRARRLILKILEELQ